MRKSKLIFLLLTLIGSGTVSIAYSQSSDKRELIAQFRKLTGASNVSGSVNFSSEAFATSCGQLFRRIKNYLVLKKNLAQTR
ncbi:MAG: hypothetical protein ABR555_11540 [Pyrinomonadaceae bacterium]